PPRRCQELADSGCEVLELPGTGAVPILSLVEELGRRDLTNVLVEGGGRVLGSFLDAEQVDAVEVFVAPLLEGGDHPRTAARGRALMRQAMRPLHPGVSQLGEDVLIRGRLPQPWRVGVGLAAD